MADSPSPIKQVLSQQAVLAVLDRWDDARTMMLNFWHSNPHLASQGGERVRQLLMPLNEVQRLHAGDLASPPAAPICDSQNREFPHGAAPVA